jgi:solute:Na+ symporter, SSS family
MIGAATDTVGDFAIWFWIAMVAYFVVILWIGVTIYRAHQKKEASEQQKDYWVASRDTNALLVGCSIAAGWLLIGFITWAIYSTYMYGIGGIWVMVIPWSILLFGMVILVPRVRSIKAISQPQMLQNRFGLSLRVLVSPFNIFCFIIWAAAEVWTIAHIVAPEFGVQPWVMYLAFSIPIAIYMWMGGFHSVLNSNVLQFFMAIIFVTVVTVAMVVVAYRDLPAGVSMGDYLSRVVPPGSGEGYNAWSIVPLGIPFIFISIVALLPGWLIEEDWWLKAQSARDTKSARKGIWANLVYNYIWVLILPSIFGLFALVVFPPETAYESVLGGDAYSIMTTFLSQEFPIWAMIILFPMLAALSMSTMATFTNVCAMNISYDILQPLVYRKRGWSDQKIMSWSRAWSLLVCGIMIAVAFTIDYLPQGLWDAYYLSSGVLTAGVAVPVFAMFWKRANLPGAFAGSAVGGLTAFIGYFVEKYVFEYDYWPSQLAATALGYAVWGVVAGIVTLIVVSLVTAPPPQERLDAISAKPVDDHAEFFAGVRETG